MKKILRIVISLVFLAGMITLCSAASVALKPLPIRAQVWCHLGDNGEKITELWVWPVKECSECEVYQADLILEVGYSTGVQKVHNKYSWAFSAEKPLVFPLSKGFDGVLSWHLHGKYKMLLQSFLAGPAPKGAKHPNLGSSALDKVGASMYTVVEGYDTNIDCEF